MNIKKMKKFIMYLSGFISLGLSVFCFLLKIPKTIIDHKSEIEMFAAGLTLPDKEKIIEEYNLDEKIPEPYIKRNISLEKSSDEEDDENNEDKKTYKINEVQFGQTGLRYDNFYIKKLIDRDINIGNELKINPDIRIKKDGTPQILIYHTHTSESYMNKDRGFYYEGWYPRSDDPSKNVVQVGEEVCEKLRKSGIGVIHDTTVHDSPSYNGSYRRSAETISKNLAKNPSIQITIDIHRDSLGSEDTGKIKPTFKVNDKKAAQIMIVSGCDDDGTLGFPDWEYNLRLALKIQQCAENLYPGMTRAMLLDQVKYNMNMTHGSMLIEVGSDANTLEEAKFSGSLLGDVLIKVLNGLT